MDANRDKQLHATVDALLVSHGNYQPVELLLKMGRLPYARYEAWRNGEFPYMEDALAGNHQRIIDMLTAAAAWAQQLALHPKEQDYQGWGKRLGASLRLFRDPATDRLARTHYNRDGDAPQLDLFFDSGPTAALNDLRQALTARNPDVAERCLATLQQTAPGHRLLSAAGILCSALSHLDDAVGDPVAELQRLEQHLAPQAREVLDGRARDFLAPFWRRLATALPSGHFDPDNDHLHGSWLAGQYLDWPAVIAAVEAVPDYPDSAVLLGRLANAQHDNGDYPKSLAACCYLCWRHPREAELWLDDSPDTMLQKSWREFQELDPALMVTWFPAWLLAEGPGLVLHLPEQLGADMGKPGQAYTLMHRLCRNKDDVELRSKLKELNDTLFRAWLARNG